MAGNPEGKTGIGFHVRNVYRSNIVIQLGNP